MRSHNSFVNIGYGVLHKLGSFQVVANIIVTASASIAYQSYVRELNFRY